MWKLVALAVTVTVAALAAPALADDQLRIKGNDTGTFSLGPPDAQGIILATDTSSGVASHLGRYDFLSHEYFDPVHNVVTHAEFTITTKHGNLTGTYTATLGVGETPNIGTYHAPGVITGGTDRYAGATGTIVFDGYGDFSNNTLVDHFTATLTLADDENDDN
jgi:hypothetical protein